MSRTNHKHQRFTGLIAPIVTHLGYDLVRVQLTGSGKHQSLQVMAERADRKPMTIDDCEKISHQLSAVLDVEDPIAAAYRLEVSSPGIDRPLTRLEDYARFAGHVATIELESPLTMADGKGRKKFQGTLAGCKNETIQLTGERGEAWSLPFDMILKAKLVLTDELINAQISN